MSKRQSRGLSELVGECVRIYRRKLTWQATYQVNGEQVRQSLNTKNKKVAIQRAWELDRKLTAGESLSRKKPATLSEVIDAYQEHLIAEQRAEATVSKYKRILKEIMTLAAILERHRISEIDLTFADKFKARRAKTLAPKSLSDEMMLLRQVTKFAFTRRMVNKDPLLGLKLKKPKPTPQPCFDDEQIAQILTLAHPPHTATFLLLAETGFRIGEAKWLTWADVDFKANVLYVRPKDGWKPKSGDVRTVPISPRLAQLLHELPRQGRWVLTSPKTRKYPANDRQIAKSTTHAALKRVLSKLEIAGKPHTFRHAFISRCLTKGIEEAVVRSWVGHVDAEIMRLYTHISSKVSQDRIKLLGKPNTEVKNAAQSNAANPA
ncbi:MAG: site-specific integrase [Planctomycetia bacterium]|nr:site-specific integrase [Planctomycetia bacterium]